MIPYKKYSVYVVHFKVYYVYQMHKSQYTESISYLKSYVSDFY